jgi:hypothetical protein
MTDGQLLAMLARLAAAKPGDPGLQTAITALQARVTAPPLGRYTSYVAHGTFWPGMDLVSTNDGSGVST